MLDNEQDLVKVLETELRFLDNGGYRNPDMWRPQFIFLDSETCVHPAGSGRPEACADCPLIGFVPRARRSAPVSTGQCASLAGRALCRWPALGFGRFHPERKRSKQ